MADLLDEHFVHVRTLVFQEKEKGEYKFVPTITNFQILAKKIRDCSACADLSEAISAPKSNYGQMMIFAHWRGKAVRLLVAVLATGSSGFSSSSPQLLSLSLPRVTVSADQKEGQGSHTFLKNKSGWHVYLAACSRVFHHIWHCRLL
jgi:hypothetical protein